MDKETKNDLIIGAMGVALGFATVRMVQMGVHIVNLEKHNSWLKQRVDITKDFLHMIAEAEEDDHAALMDKYDTDIRFLDQMHGC